MISWSHTKLEEVADEKQGIYFAWHNSNIKITRIIS